MSSIGLDPQETQNAVDYMEANPGAPRAAPWFTWATPLAIGTGAAVGVSHLQLLGEELGAPYVKSFAYGLDKQFGTTSFDWLNEQQRQFRNTVVNFQVKPETYGRFGEAIGGLAQYLVEGAVGAGIGALATPEAAGAGAIPGTIAVVGMAENLVSYHRHLAEGVDPKTARIMAAKDALLAGGTAALPLAGKTTLNTAIRQGIVMSATSAMDRGVSHVILEKAGYPEMAKQYQAFDTTAIATDAAMGFLFGSIFHQLHGAPPAERLPTLADTTLGRKTGDHLEQGGPGIPADDYTRKANIDATEKAIEDTLHGTEVNVTDQIDPERAIFAIDPHDAEYRKNIEDAVNEEFPPDERPTEPPPPPPPGGGTPAAEAPTSTEAAPPAVPEAIALAQKSNTFTGQSVNAGNLEGRTQPKGTPVDRIFSNFADEPRPHHLTDAGWVARQLDFRAKMFDRANSKVQAFAKDPVKTHEEPFGDGMTVRVDAAESGRTRVQVLQNGEVVAAARFEHGKFDSIAVAEHARGQNIGRKLVEWVDRNKIGNIDEVPDRSPGYVKVLKAIRGGEPMPEVSPATRVNALLRREPLTPSKNLDDLIAQTKERNGARNEAFRILQGTADGWSARDSSTTARMVLTPDVEAPGKWRITHIDEQGEPLGHVQYDDFRAAARDFLLQAKPGSVEHNPPAAATPREPIKVEATGKTGEITYGDKNEKAKVTWAIVEADSLNPTMTEAENQKRDRTRVASVMQVSNIANDPDFALLGVTNVMDTGAPTLAADGTIVAGNGRSDGLKQAYANGTAGKYTALLRQNAADAGLKAEDFAHVKQPVLVRILEPGVDIEKLAVASNEGGAARMSALEQAKVDAARLPDIKHLIIGENGRVSVAQNKEIISKWVAEFPLTEQPALLPTAGGELSAEGMMRLRNALLTKAYGESEILTRLIEDADPDVKNVGNALIRAAPETAKVQDAIKAGELHPRDLTPDLTKAVEEFAKAKATGRSVAEVAGQGDLLGGMSPEASKLLAFMERYSRSPRALADLISSYYEKLRMAGNPNQHDIFGAPPAEKGAILDEAIAAKDKTTALEQSVRDAKKENPAMEIPQADGTAVPVDDAIAAADRGIVEAEQSQDMLNAAIDCDKKDST